VTEVHALRQWLGLRKWRTQQTWYRWRHHYFDDFIFVHINKTGGTSIKAALKLPHVHRTAQQLVDTIGWEAWHRKISFAVVRNPWDRVVSQYHYRLQMAKASGRRETRSFPEWVRACFGDPEERGRMSGNPIFYQPQTAWLQDKDGRIIVDRILKFETLAYDFAELCRELGLHCRLPHLKASRRGPYQQYYDRETIALVARWFADDIAMFGYTYARRWRVQPLRDRPRLRHFPALRRHVAKR